MGISSYSGCCWAFASVDAFVWHRLWSSFVSASVALCNSLTAVPHRLYIHDVDSTELMNFVACRLIPPLDIKPEVWPIIGDVPGWIIAKAVLHVIGNIGGFKGGAWGAKAPC